MLFYIRDPVLAYVASRAFPADKISWLQLSTTVQLYTVRARTLFSVTCRVVQREGWSDTGQLGPTFCLLLENLDLGHFILIKTQHNNCFR